MTDLTSNGGIINTSRELLRLYERGEHLADLIRDRDKRVRHHRPMDMQNTTRGAIASRIWRREGRQVLVMHPAVVEEVAVANSDRISGKVLQTLPFMSPMVVYASPPEFKTWVTPEIADPASYTYTNESALKLMGFITYSHAPVRASEDWGQIQATGLMGGGTRMEVTPKTSMYDIFEKAIYHTHDPRGTDFGIAAMFQVIDDVGKRIDYEITMMSLPLDEGAYTFTEMVDSLLEKFQFATGHDGDNPQTKKWMRQVMATIVGTLLYLCSTTLEAEIDKLPRKQAAKIQPEARKPPPVYKVGWRMGAALTALRQKTLDRSDGGSALPGRDQGPQHRKGHFKMQPYGPNNTLRKLIYVSPYWTHLEKLGLYDIKTVRRVPLVGPAGSARDSMRSVLGVSNAMQETG